MKRRSFDLLVTSVGALLTIALLVASGLLFWGADFANTTVHNQLAQQEIFFPSKAAFAHPKAGTEITPSMIPSVSQYAGQQLLTGQQAEVWANDFIAVHLNEMGGGKTYAQLSTLSMEQPTNTALANTVNLVFRGTTLRGLLLNAYAYSVFGSIAQIAAIGTLVLGLVLLVLTVLGFVHYRRTDDTKEFPAHAA